MPAMSIAELHRFLKDEFPQAPPNVTVEQVSDTSIRVRQKTSDRNLKKDIAPLGPTLDKVMTLQPATYRLKEDADDAPAHTGLIAQDVERVFPEAVQQAGDHLALNYTDLSVAGLKALQELKREKDAEISELKTANAALLKRLEVLEQAIK